MFVLVAGILSVPELQSFAATIELFITEAEGRKMLTSMDVGDDEKVLESDFIEFMKRKDDVLKKTGQRLRHAGMRDL
jgi:Ca2+-binding EF-hand superfamily protein